MTRTFAFAIALAFAAGAGAQQYKWVDKDGKVRYGDTPPAGVKATPLRGPAAAPAPAPAPQAATKDAGKEAKRSGPLTPAEQEAEFRKRQQEAAKQREQEEKLAMDAQRRREACESARSHLRTLESGGRISRLNEKGERVFVEDDQRAGETARARKGVADNCS